MQSHIIVSREDWLAARKAHLAKEKEFTRARDALSRERRELPWVKVDKDYVFDGPAGKVQLADLFAGKSQLIVQHFMFHPDWTAGCKSCSFWADNFEGVPLHLAARDTAFAAVSRAPLAKLETFKKRMGWTFPWVSSAANSFNKDFGVHFTPDEIKRGASDYNFGSMKFQIEDAPGISVFSRNAKGEIFHSYSCYGRGVDMLNGAYHYLDLTPLGRDESGGHNMSWVRLHDEYGAH